MARSEYELSLDAARYVDSPDDPEALGIAVSGIREGCDQFNMKNWNFMLRTSGFALQANISTYNFPSGIRTPRHMAMKNGGQTVPLGYLDPKSFFLEWPGTGAGEPSIYTVVPDGAGGSNVRFNSAPATDNLAVWPSGELTYFARVPYPATSGSTLGVPPEAEMVILEYARMYMAERYAPEKMAGPKERFQAGYRQLQIDETTDWNED
jgi:hypothetical protein